MPHSNKRVWLSLRVCFLLFVVSPFVVLSCETSIASTCRFVVQIALRICSDARPLDSFRDKRSYETLRDHSRQNRFSMPKISENCTRRRINQCIKFPKLTSQTLNRHFKNVIGLTALLFLISYFYFSYYYSSCFHFDPFVFFNKNMFYNPNYTSEFMNL